MLSAALLGAAKIQYSTPGVSFQLTVIWLSPGTRLSPPSGGAGGEEEEPPQAAKMMAAAKASNETRIECKDMKISCAEPSKPNSK
jgi:hypothetical protein